MQKINLQRFSLRWLWRPLNVGSVFILIFRPMLSMRKSQASGYLIFWFYNLWSFLNKKAIFLNYIFMPLKLLHLMRKTQPIILIDYWLNQLIPICATQMGKSLWDSSALNYNLVLSNTPVLNHLHLPAIALSDSSHKLALIIKWLVSTKLNFNHYTFKF